MSSLIVHLISMQNYSTSTFKDYTEITDHDTIALLKLRCGKFYYVYNKANCSDRYIENKTLGGFVFFITTYLKKTTSVFVDFCSLESLCTHLNFEVITGPMCSGKSKKATKLVKYCNVVPLTSLHSRCTKTMAVCAQMHSTNANKTVLIDEFQFLDIDYSDLLKNKYSVLCGLIFTFQQQVFPLVDVWFIILHAKKITWCRKSYCNDPSCKVLERHEGIYSKKHLVEHEDVLYNLNKNDYFVSCLL